MALYKELLLFFIYLFKTKLIAARACPSKVVPFFGNTVLIFSLNTRNTKSTSVLYEGQAGAEFLNCGHPF